VFLRTCHWPLSWPTWIQFTIPLYLFEFQFNIVLLSIPRASKQLLAFMFGNQNSVSISLFSNACNVLCPYHHVLFHHPNNWDGYKCCILTCCRQKDLYQGNS
jgi:hypothetical protein